MVCILLVDDNPADVRLVREGLRSCSIAADLIIADDGEQALKMLSDGEVKPAFMIVDLNLPKFSGLDLLERLCASERPPVIVLSGSENPRDKKRALELGASEYILKPLDYEAFIQQIAAAIEKWGASAFHTTA